MHVPGSVFTTHGSRSRHAIKGVAKRMKFINTQSTDGSKRLLRRRLLARGVVQGVGFRPYVFRLARQYGLSGFVKNSSFGAVIEIEGTDSAIATFEHALPLEGPQLMHIGSMEAEDVEPTGEQGFAILASESGDSVLALVPADVAVCEECLAEIHDAANRRFEYPFTNCTNCGPRYSIIRDVPYDRAATTMADFEMCPACRAEYQNPEDRRFHAQPIACPACGPHLWAVDPCGRKLPLHGTRPVLEAVISLLRSGEIVAWKGLGGYQLACDARNDAAVQRLRERKRRNAKAFAVMVRDEIAAETLCNVSAEERALLTGPERPIVLLRPRSGGNVAANVAPGNPLLGVMLPCTPMHELLFSMLDEACGSAVALVMTSGNMSEEPIVMEERSAEETLRSVVDLFVHHNRPIHTRVDDSVTRLVDGKSNVLRRARGFTPTALPLAQAQIQLLACGAQQKSTLCLTKDGFAMLSQHLGDLENYETLKFFEETLERMQRLFQIAPEAVAHDLHPGYLSTQLAQGMNVRKIGVQHHHAHITSCMAEHGLDGQVLGVAWDGTGFGLDGTIWGGEFLVAGFGEFERYAHLRNVQLAGGDTAVREPWRVARSYLRDAFDSIMPPGLGLQHSVPESSIRMVDVLLEKRIHTIDTSSCGRLFDAVASLVGLHQLVSFEGQAAMALEAIADGANEAYNFTIEGQRPSQVDMRQMVREIVDDVQRGEPANKISARFHNTLVKVVGGVCARMRKDTGLRRVCLSGGCFQNVRLLQACLHTLRSDNFEVFFQQQVPCNDGGIAFGQAAVACELLRRGA